MRRRISRTHTKEADINITSLLDVVFVLLITFMVVAPAMKYGVELDLPKVGDSKTGEEKKKPVSIQVKYIESGSSQFFVNGKPMELESVPSSIKSIPGYAQDPVVALHADKRVPWEDVARLINELRSNQINRIGIVTEKAARS